MSMASLSQATQNAKLAAHSANTISEFIAYEQVRTLADLQNTLFQPFATESNQQATSALSSASVVVLCASAVLSTADTVLSMVTKLGRDTWTATQHTPIVLVLCGGIGHSTQLMHEAVIRHPMYHQIAEQVRGQPEARILQAIGEKFFNLHVHDINQGPLQEASEDGLLVLVEDASTSCALNAQNTRKVLEAHGVDSPLSIVVAQDPTMCRRTAAAFEQVYADKAERPPVLASWPTFIPKVAAREGMPVEEDSLLSSLEFAMPGLDASIKDGLWSMGRFTSLLVGEIPRMRDDENGYGPRGKGSIAHVDIPRDVEEAWKLLCHLLDEPGRARVNDLR
ncbi:hypothetical protein ACJZ2D_009050 [Fusarium nematophilum]